MTKLKLTPKGEVTVQMICEPFLETVREAGEAGAPSGPMYLAAQSYGISLYTYTSIMQILVNSGRIRLSNHVYYFIK